ncbi:predicted protein [Histoplasma mississippiense (nom. inval.)]|uniref:predicted protein n=1 Tax=Ajellomyces capsulatus (strain NAm1 / WU24) TaxID=2059318 RepID=UPI000157C327|nr:predicted protein [Histoplasma mississippiense (nom. inval.)]EDN07901.1 predicted protein [Histoplasma mississippiense (nom. inval.)]
MNTWFLRKVKDRQGRIIHVSAATNREQRWLVNRSKVMVTDEKDEGVEGIGGVVVEEEEKRRE